jgi:CHAT domain-containing protein
VDRTFAVQTERQQIAFSNTVRYHLDSFLSFSVEAEASASDAYSHVLAWKGAVLAARAYVHGLRGDQEVEKLFQDYLSASTRLATAAMAVPAPEARQRWREQLQELTEEQERLELALSARSEEFLHRRSAARLTPSELQAVLPPDAALLDLLVYSHSRPAKEKKGGWDRQWRIVAFVLRPKQPLAMIDLGPLKPVTQALHAWRKSVLAKHFASEAVCRELRTLLWAKLEKPLEGAHTILISPDGVLGTVPWAALPGAKPQTFLLEERAVAVVPAPQLLPPLLAGAGNVPARDSLLLVGDVAYGGSAGRADDLVLASRSPATDSRDGERWAWRRLEHSLDEINGIGRRFRIRFPSGALTELSNAEVGGKPATESAFRQQAQAHRWLHVVTHGYFAPPDVVSALTPPKEDPDRFGMFGQKGVAGWHPGLLSGLALAGANTPPEKRAEGEDDGILTATEVAGLDLRGVEMAVLSACDTGLGEVAGGEGVLGLQRAFQVAGARTTVTSLWKVPDRATKELMIKFYDNLWNKKLPKLEALRQAQLWMLRDEGKLRAFDPDAKDQPETDRLPPYYWAAFLLSGDWR